MRPIDADKLILSLRKCAEDEHSKRASTTWANACEDFIDEIEDLLVDDKDEVAPVVYAEWEDNGANYKCSNCGNTEPYYDMLYCPHCGAKMEDSNE